MPAPLPIQKVTVIEGKTEEMEALVNAALLAERTFFLAKISVGALGNGVAVCACVWEKR